MEDILSQVTPKLLDLKTFARRESPPKAYNEFPNGTKWGPVDQPPLKICNEPTVVHASDRLTVNMPPDSKAADAVVSNEVATLTPTPPAVAAPMVKPLNVTVNADAPMLAPDVVMTTAVEVVAPHVAVRPATLLAPTVKVGVTDGAKKPDG